MRANIRELCAIELKYVRTVIQYALKSKYFTLSKVYETFQLIMDSRALFCYSTTIKNVFQKYVCYLYLPVQFHNLPITTITSPLLQLAPQ